MRKTILTLAFMLCLTSGFSQTRKITGDSIWIFSHPDFVSLKEALDSSLLLSSSYEKSNWIFVFSEDSMTVKSYLKDSLAETSPICEIIKQKKQTTYKTHPIINGKPHDGQFTIFYKDKRKRKPDLLVAGYSDDGIECKFIVFHLRSVK